ncbi:UvrD-helicase domain-containing protein [Chryseobacterium sp. CFBP8996]|uniref:UvrD-helicase domain-containing protein n=1 Tax=Chryseobacterium sp. CFBP8996 TaxID=3096529 RepID=UPI002A6AAAA9|nr:UvrD-helicase domain-containing protein [Chryseobacterium sp. CFBP8996]MDY0931120.1 UvrD-helicase domain-containing protein [Chryseobacterium sp. CFBP8996]
MPSENEISPAEKASQECLELVYKAIDDNENFLVEAGAGAGKTYTLIKALKYLIKKYEVDYEKSHKRIACITFTNVAKDEIQSRTDNHPIIIADTIHAFAWDCIKGFQKELRNRIGGLSDKWQIRVDETGLKSQEVIYNLGYPKMTDKEIYLHHNDVIKLFIFLLNEKKFRKLFSSNYPIILIDEYQDTNKDLANAIVDKFILTREGSKIGFFGDHWRKIYGSESCGLIEADEDKLRIIGKKANFRSDKNIVEMLNRLRPELQQHEYDSSSEGELLVLQTNNWEGERRQESHWKDDLPEETAHKYLESVKEKLTNNGWDLSSTKTKILMLTNNVLAAEQGYQNVANVFDTEDYLKKNDDYIAFLTDVVEVGWEAFNKKKYGEMLKVLGLKQIGIKKHHDKEVWHDAMVRLSDLRQTGTVGQVIELLKSTSKPQLSRKIEEKEFRYSTVSKLREEDRSDEDKVFFDKITRMRAIAFTEITNVSKYIDDQTLYSTKHGVKSAEFENVIVVFGRGWNLYNWNQFLEWYNSGNIPAAKKDAYERNRNLFYVACSRPKKRLCLLFTQELSEGALQGLNKLFGDVINSA